MIQLSQDDLNYYRNLIRRAGIPPSAHRDLLEAQEAMREASAANVMRDALQTRQAFQDAGIGFQNHIQQMLASTVRPLVTAATKNIYLKDSAYKAAVQAAQSAQATQFRRVAKDFANATRVHVPTEDFASAQAATVRRMLDDGRLRQSIEQLAAAPLADFRKQYAETMRRSIGLLSDETVRRMTELAESMQTIQQGTIAADEMEATLGDMVAAEDVESEALDPSRAIDTLLRFVRMAILLLSFAAITASTDPSYAEYKEPINEALSRLAIMERALDMYKEREDSKKRDDESND